MAFERYQGRELFAEARGVLCLNTFRRSGFKEEFEAFVLETI